MSDTNIEDKDEAWDAGLLGRDEKFAHAVHLSKEDEVKINDAIGVGMIAIMLEKELIKECKRIAKLRGTTHKILIKQLVIEFIEKNKT